MKYRKKPVTIEAVQFFVCCVRDFEDMCTEIGLFEDKFIGGKLVRVFPSYDYDEKARVTSFYIKTLEGEMKVSDGDWVIRGVKEEFYPCKPDIFKQTYEVVKIAPRFMDSDER